MSDEILSTLIIFETPFDFIHVLSPSHDNGIKKKKLTKMIFYPTNGTRKFPLFFCILVCFVDRRNEIV